MMLSLRSAYFIHEKDNENFIRSSYFDSKQKIIFMDPFRLLDFAEQIKGYAEEMPADADFEKYRMNLSWLKPVNCQRKVYFSFAYSTSSNLRRSDYIGLSEIRAS